MMSRLDLSRSSKGLMQRMEAMVRATLPRQAQVTRTEGSSVWVRFLGDTADSPEAKFPSTVAGVPPDTMGWVITLGGKKGLFVASAATTKGQVHSASRTSATPVSTTAIVASSANYTLLAIIASDTLTTWIPEITDGLWDVDIIGSATVYRSVAGGGAWLAVGSDTEGGPVLSRNFTLTNGFGLVSAYSLKAVTPATLIQMRMAGWNVAGTTNYPTWAMQVTARRVG